MTIDIISYTDEQYAQLSEEQILEVQSAQLKKERLKARLEEDIVAQKNELLSQGVFRSDIFALCKDKLQKKYDLEVENLRDSLLFYLRFAAKAPTSEVGYLVDYSLPVPERYIVVRDYYVGKYSDADERFAAFRNDKVAPVYLNETYSTLYALFKAETSDGI